MFAQAFLRLGEWVGIQSAHQSITVSQTLKKYVRTKYSRALIYLPNGCPEVKRLKSSATLARFGLRKNEYFLSVSRLIRHKGIHTLIKAYRKLRTTKKLVIVGDGAFTESYVRELRGLADGDRRIVFVGNQTGRALAELYSHAYVFVQPSEAEGMSIALLEALAYGRPALVSDIDANKEVLGSAMLTFRNKQVRDLTNKLKFLAKHPEQVAAMSRAARHIVQRYQWKGIVNGTEALYRLKINEVEVLPMFVSRKMLEARVK